MSRTIFILAAVLITLSLAFFGHNGTPALSGEYLHDADGIKTSYRFDADHKVCFTEWDRGQLKSEQTGEFNFDDDEIVIHWEGIGLANSVFRPRPDSSLTAVQPAGDVVYTKQR